MFFFEKRIISDKCSVCLIFFLIFVQSCCSQQCPNHCSLVGKWDAEGFSEGYTEYTEDERFKSYSIGEYTKLISGDLEADTFFTFGRKGLKYELLCRNDSLIRRTWEGLEDDQFDNDVYIMHCSDEEVIWLNYKGLPDIRDHISGIGLQRRYDGQVHLPFYDVPEHEIKERIVVPEDFEGYVFILHGQDTTGRGQVEVRSNGVRVFRTSDDGVVSTQLKIDVFTRAHKRYAVYQGGNRLQMMDWNVMSRFMQQMTSMRRYLDTFDKTSPCAVDLRINRFGRELINEKLGRKITGNVAIFYVGKYEDVVGKMPKLLD